MNSETSQASNKPKNKKKTDGNESKVDRQNKADTKLSEEIPEKNKQLSEKELRKLEWEKKNAQQLPQKDKENISKSELKAKRREQQEAQRLAKSSALTNKSQLKPKANEPEPKAVVKTDTKPLSEVKQKSPSKPDIKKKKDNKVQLVQHLYNSELGHSTLVNYEDVHPAFVKLGVQYSKKIILGANARTLALLSALKHLVRDLQTPPKQEFCRYLESILQSCTIYLQSCRPFAVSMTNALRQFKVKLTQMNNDSSSDNMKKAKLLEIIDDYVTDEINKAGDAISIKVNRKISDGDVLLIYGCSSLIKKILLEAHSNGKQFQVIIVDSRPLLEGREMLRRLNVAGIKCTYILINALSYIMSHVTKVLLGAHALLTNGYVMSRIGTAQVALMAQVYNKPVLVCCETYKFSERVQTDSFVYNEIGDSNKLCSVDTLEETSPLVSMKENPKVQILSLLYDVTPPDLITAVVTELAILPCTSVPVVLRIIAN